MANPNNADPTPPEASNPEIGTAYELLSKPTLTLTDEESLAIVRNLREKRAAFLKGKADNPRKAKTAAKKGKTTAAEKAANTQALMSKLSLGGVKLKDV